MNTSSNKMFSKTNNKVVPVTPSCKVCKDAGLSETVYSSHWVKNKDGHVVCPTLLAQKCRCCGKNGHTVSFCPDKDRFLKIQSQSQSKPVKRSSPPPQPKKQSPTNVFATLDCDSDSGSDAEMNTKEEYPKIFSAPEKNIQRILPAQFSYASMASKTKVDFEVQQIVSQKISLPLLNQKSKLDIPISKPAVKKSWVQQQMEDSSDEEYEIESSAW